MHGDTPFENTELRYRAHDDIATTMGQAASRSLASFSREQPYVHICPGTERWEDRGSRRGIPAYGSSCQRKVTAAGGGKYIAASIASATVASPGLQLPRAVCCRSQTTNNPASPLFLQWRNWCLRRGRYRSYSLSTRGKYGTGAHRSTDRQDPGLAARNTSR